MASDEKSQILGKIGNRVIFKYPGAEGKRSGKLLDRHVFGSHRDTGVPYWDVVDLIRFENEDSQWMRVGYYRKPKDRLVWGSQTTITEPVQRWQELLVSAAREKPWFRKLLEDVLKEVQGRPADDR